MNRSRACGRFGTSMNNRPDAVILYVIRPNPHRAKMANFKIKHLFVLITMSALFIPFVQYCPALAIMVLACMLIAILNIVLLASLRGWFENARLTKKSLCFIGLTIFWITTYISSVGPAVAIAMNYGNGPEMLETFYRPVRWLHDHTVLEEPLEWYGGLWGWY